MKKQEVKKTDPKRNSRLLVPILLVLAGVLAILIYRMIGSKEPENLPNVDEEYLALPESNMDPSHPDYDKIENGVHIRTGFAEGENLMLVVNNCTTCHSAKLVTQNRMSKEQWVATIRWMQETQNLWDLGTNEEPIVNYLAIHYAPIQKGRRQNLPNIDWYELKEK